MLFDKSASVPSKPVVRLKNVAKDIIDLPWQSSALIFLRHVGTMTFSLRPLVAKTSRDEKRAQQIGASSGARLRA
ncbi:hypothetical protein [Bradyrhizobium sp.]|uniref:hypothetical protein n=1 Tax=Bradyrhizobium sp. TaxID=376 RepID=UPI003C34CB3E